MLKKLIILSLFVFAFNSCSKDNEIYYSSCGTMVIVSEKEYQTAPNDHLVIDSLRINGDCLIINFSSGGCNGDSWALKLIDSGAVMESYPPQRNLRLSLKNEELCDAWLAREISFDISALQLDGQPVWLNLSNSDKRILYEY